jgi:hypothetical protein
MGKMTNTYKILVRKLEGKRPLGKLRHRWKGIRMDFREIDANLICLAQDRDQWQAATNTVMNLQVTYKVGNLTN